ncbi:Ti-type conjugative transfer relaxase TraA [Rhizobium tropici]|uniref:Ti-type conjugative transfer relaxase TraA n=1 Tax=Rhizobium tropici TaxID=398 RepID=A0A329YEV3_RHITR|nr:Ti-type conjugative transfer relaxase TraA [Rhizobium tropici]RAX41946.1 Ti-type conjugative transfer relaxase TraA [Rhizobium tropici]
MAIMFLRAKMISRGAGQSVVSAAAYRHRTKMTDEQVGTKFRYSADAAELIHEELAVPEDTPAWLRILIDGRSVAGASEALWNAVDRFETRRDARFAREIILALPNELSRRENIALVRDFVRENFVSRGMVADWVYHDKKGNPHVHVMTTLRPLTAEGFGPKHVAIVDDTGEPLRLKTPDRPKGAIIYRPWAGNKATLEEWKLAWAQTVTHHLALAGHDIRIDGRSYEEQGLRGMGQRHLAPARVARLRKGADVYFAPAALAQRYETADRLAANPGLLLRQLSNERSTFDEAEIARALHRHVDDPIVFANIRAKLMASDDLVMLRPQQVSAETGGVELPAVFTTRATIRTEFHMARSALNLSNISGFAVSSSQVDAAIVEIEAAPNKAIRLDAEQVDAVRHITADSGIAAVVGIAGAGKSTLLSVARIAWERDGRRVLGAALAGKAVEALNGSSGIRSRTIAAWELAWKNDYDLLQKGDVLVLDEAGMVSSEQMARLLKRVEDAGAKAVLVGDAMQLQPIQAGASFRAIVERIGFTELVGVRRQRHEWAREASRLLARGNVEEALSAYSAHGHLLESDTRNDAVQRIVSDWASARLDAIAKAEVEGRKLRGDELMVLAHTNSDVRRLNDAIRAVMLQQDALGESRSFRTERGIREFSEGDRIIFLENARFVEPKAPHLTVQHVKNGMFGTVISIAGRGGVPFLFVRLDSGRDVMFSEDTYRNVDHGYAATIHKSQGSTFDRAFVLATGMMDRHLTYVAMTRHRERADLYVARGDFQPQFEWGKPARVEHAAGITGELVEIGLAKFRERDGAGPSPSVDVRTNDGTTHRLWGVSLPKALEEAGMGVGDTVTVRKDGTEKVTVKVPVIDEETGARHFEDRVVERNIWTAYSIDKVQARMEQLAADNHRPTLFAQLVERLSRPGEKTTTLDFENEASYQSVAFDFARRRGIDTIADYGHAVEAQVERLSNWLAIQRDHVAQLWQRSNVPFGATIETPGRNTAIHATDDKDALPASVADTSSLLPAVKSLTRSIAEDARLAQLASPQWKEREALLRPVLERIYRESDKALSRLNEQSSNLALDPGIMADRLSRSPQSLGALRGSNTLIDGRDDRATRADALAAVSELVVLARAHATEFRKQADRFDDRERRRRLFMEVTVPGLSDRARGRLAELEAIRQRGGQEAYHTAFRITAEDRSVVQEIKAVSEALNRRFGRDAFTEKTDQFADRETAMGIPETIDKEKRSELIAIFTAVKRFAAEQQLAEQPDRLRIVAPATPDDLNTIPAMLPSVTKFKVSLDEEARMRVTDAEHYKQIRAALVATASVIWRDPAAALTIIEDLVRKQIDPERIARAVATEPTAYGPMRGTGRAMDRLLAGGRERREALQAIEAVGANIRSLGRYYLSAFENEKSAVMIERGRMAIPIPALTRTAQKELRHITSETEKNPRELARLVRSLSQDVRQEFSLVSKALDARFGPGAILRNETDVANMVSKSQQAVFKAILGQLRTVQRAVAIDRAEEIIAERQRRTINRARGVDR